MLAHTMNGEILDVRVTGRAQGRAHRAPATHRAKTYRSPAVPRGEIGLNAAMAGHLGVPVVLLSGDDAACAEAAALIPEAVTVPVKEALGMAAAVTLHPRRPGTGCAVRRGRGEPPYGDPPWPSRARWTWRSHLASPHTIDLATLIPGVSRATGRPDGRLHGPRLRDGVPPDPAAGAARHDQAGVGAGTENASNTARLAPTVTG